MIPNWFRDAIGYEVYPQSFMDQNNDGIGDLCGITAKLDYIRDLGCNLIWVNPCFDSPMMDAGYDVRDYRKVAPRYGTNDDLIALFHAAHDKGVRVLLDLVPGHTSMDHPWFVASQKHERNEYSDRYIWTDFIFDKPKDYYWITGRTERNGCAMINCFDTQPSLNYGFAQVTQPWQKRYTEPCCKATFDDMLDVMRFWLDLGCDGFRVDMAFSLVKDDPEKDATASLWQRAQEMLRSEYPEAVLISEWGDPEKALCKAGFQGDFYVVFAGEGAKSLLRNGEKTYFRSAARGDLNIFLNEYDARYAASRKDGYICFITGNHDEERVSTELSQDELKLAYAFLLTLPGVPFVYAGDEIGMRQLDLPSKEGGYYRTGCRTPMQWDDSHAHGFSTADTSRLYLPQDNRPDAPNVAAQRKDAHSLWRFLQSLLALRAAQADLRADAPYEPVYVGERGYPFVYRRGGLLLAMNVTQETKTIPQTIQSPLFVHGAWRTTNEGTELAPQSFVVWEAASSAAPLR